MRKNDFGILFLFQSIEKKGTKREANLLNAIKFFNFKSQCERCKFWLSERQRDLLNMKAGTGSSENSLKVDEICKSIAKYENNVIDLRRQAEELSLDIPSRKDQVGKSFTNQKQKKIHNKKIAVICVPLN